MSDTSQTSPPEPQRRKGQESFVDQAWNLLKSMKFAIILLLIITAASIVNLFAGEFIVPVRGGAAEAMRTWSEHYGQLRASLLTFFQMYSPYTSWWYSGLLGLLLLSLIVCVIDRAPLTFRRSFKTRLPRDEAGVRSLALTAELEGDRLEELRRMLKKRGWRVRSEGGRLEAVSSPWAHMGSWLVHIGFILLVLGGALIARGGISASVAGMPGETVFGVGKDRGLTRTWDFQVRVDDFVIEYHPLAKGQYVQHVNGSIGRITGKHEDGGFEVEFYTPERRHGHNVPADSLNNRIDRQMQGGRLDQMNIADYVAMLSVLRNGEVIKQDTIEVNKPMRFEGYRFYQSSFNDQRRDDQGRWTTILNVRRDRGAPFVWSGILIVSLGLTIGLYFVPRRIVALAGEGRTLVGGSTRRSRSLFEERFAAIVEKAGGATGQTNSSKE